MRRRGETALSGILPIDKPAGMTSHDVVNAVRRATGERRVGHAGTLDPLATGLLIVMVGPATRLARFFGEHPKTYRAAIVLGTETATDDAEGEVTRTADVARELVGADAARRAIAELVGPHRQVPPAFSAVKVAGRKAYEIARRGGEAELAARLIEVYSAELAAVEDGPPIVWDAELTVSGGTYIRSLARDLGCALGTAAHLGGLTRTASGGLVLAQACTLDEVAQAGRDGTIGTLFVDPVAALGMPTVALDAKVAERVGTGATVSAAEVGCHAADIGEGGHAAMVAGGRLLAVYGRSGESLEPLVVLGRPVEGVGMGEAACESRNGVRR